MKKQLLYKPRVIKSFDYETIKEKINSCKPKLLTNNIYIDSGLCVPQVRYGHSRYIDEPSEDFLKNKDYREIELNYDEICLISFWATKHLFKKDEFTGRVDITWFRKYNDYEKFKEYVESTYNAITPYGKQKYFKFTTYEELEGFLKGLESVVNEIDESYFYFDHSEAIDAASVVKNNFLVKQYEKDLVELNNKLEQTKNTEEKQKIDLCELINELKTNIKETKRKLRNLYK